MKTAYAALALLACFLVTAVLEKQWEQPQRKTPQAKAERATLAMPCTWICQGSEMKCARLENRKCVNADRSQ